MSSRTRYKVLLHAAVPKELRELPHKVRQRAKDTIASLADNPVPLGSRRLLGRKNAYRIRIQDYRILYEVHATEIVVYIVGVAHRREVYRKILPRR